MSTFTKWAGKWKATLKQSVPLSLWCLARDIFSSGVVSQGSFACQSKRKNWRNVKCMCWNFSIIKIPIVLDKKNQFWSVIFLNILCIPLQLVSFVNNFRSWDSHRKLFFQISFYFTCLCTRNMVKIIVIIITAMITPISSSENYWELVILFVCNKSVSVVMNKQLPIIHIISLNCWLFKWRWEWSPCTNNTS